MRLSLEERLRLVEDLWDSIATEAAGSPERLPSAGIRQKKILRRSEALCRNPSEAIPLDHVLDHVAASLG